MTFPCSREPRWRADGKALSYLEYAEGNRTKVVSVQSARDRIPSVQRFLINVYATEAQPSLEVLLNWAQATGDR